MMKTEWKRVVVVLPAAGAVVFSSILAVGWGTPTHSTVISVTARDVGKRVELAGIPQMIRGGVVKFQLTNRARDSHGLALIRVLGNHTASEGLKVFTNPQSNQTPQWVRAEGGVGIVDPGNTKSAVVDLPAGRYVAFDYNSIGPSAPNAQFIVTSAKPGSLPQTTGRVTARKIGKDRYAWATAGLRRGTNLVTFTSKGKDAIHLIFAVPVGRHSLAQVRRALASVFIDHKPPPAFLAFQHSTDAPSLDGGLREVTQLDLRPGTYAFLCPLTDRNGGKPHFLEGLLKEVTIK